MQLSKPMLFSTLILILFSWTPSRAEWEPGRLDLGFNPGAGANSTVLALAVQADGKVLLGGNFTTVDGTTRCRIARLHADGSLDTAFDPGGGADNRVFTLAVQTDGRIMLGGSFTTVGGASRNYLARLHADGSLDASFDPGSGADTKVRSAKILPDGKILIGGEFTAVNGTVRNRIARLHPNGFLDASFDPGAGANAVVNDLALQADGKVIVSGAFATIDGTARGRIARLHTDGSLDVSFDPGTGADHNVWTLALQVDGRVLAGGEFTVVAGRSRGGLARLNRDGTLDAGLDPGVGPSNEVQVVAEQPDGKVLIGGYFTVFDGTGRNRIARLNLDGSLDTSFDPGSGATGAVLSMVPQPDGRIIIGGRFTAFDGQGRIRIARLHATGALDTSFDPGTGADTDVTAVAVQDGKVFVGGYFTTVAGVGRNRIARLHANGTLDAGFNPSSGANERVLCLAVQPDGKVLIGGNFTTVNGTARNRLARLHTDGALDTSFDPGVGVTSFVRAIALQPDGKVLIGGSFTTVAGSSRNRVARLQANGSLDTSFDPGVGADNFVDTVVIQSDGRVIIGGAFTKVNNLERGGVARLNPDGSLDTAFDPGSGANGNVYDAAIQPDGKVLIGGDFTTVNGTARNRLARLNGATPPVITSSAPLAAMKLGGNFQHTFTAYGYPYAPSFYLTGGSLPAGLTLDGATGVLSGSAKTPGNFPFTVSACNFIAPCGTQAGNLEVEGGLLYLPLLMRQE